MNIKRELEEFYEFVLMCIFLVLMVIWDTYLYIKTGGEERAWFVPMPPQGPDPDGIIHPGPKKVECDD